MSTKVAQGKSKDDLSIPAGGLNLIPLNSDRRTRSNSPVKNRYSLPPNLTDYKLPSIPRMNDDIKSIMSSTSSNQERLKQAAKSPIAKDYTLLLQTQTHQIMEVNIQFQFHSH